MSKRKRGESVSEDTGCVGEASDSKKEKLVTQNESVEEVKKTVVSENTDTKPVVSSVTKRKRSDTPEETEEGEGTSVKVRKNETPGSSISTAEKPKTSLEAKSKGTDAELEEPPTKKLKKDLSEKEKDVEKKPTKVIKKRLSRNDCVCSIPNGTQLVQNQAQEEDAHIQVDEWRLHKFQSPIELKHDESIHHDHFEPLEFHGHWDKEGDATFSNNGFTATLRFYNRELPILKGGPLHEDEYVFEQLHFHWSEDDHSGCEHIFEGQAYSMEAHAVHYNSKYSDFVHAANKPDGLAVVAFFIQATDNENYPCFDKLSAAVQDIIKINSTTNVAPDCLTWFKEAAQCKGYYTYQGSLTTKPYTESVTWILYPQPIHVSRDQVANFRNLNSTPCEKHNITKNVRPIQTPPEHKKLNVFFARSHRHSNSD